ncbi:signal peptidase I [Sphingomicrobium sediminis]|uniref:Signal peptidase I n=1 Tax=Sphingomicrobium sediminis TaxID=2950949 RepID=A0A9X2J3D7_9SPHN|nr:signal peptidase I [Sphingomicrobium sediminis]MCM8557201.1 signal peptidase I [Sphingomicrobium sediminis]
MIKPFTKSKEKKDKADEGKGGFFRFLIFLVIFAWGMRSFVAAPFSIPSGSMLPTMWVGDYLVVSKWPYGYSRYSFPFGIPSFDGRIFEGDPEPGDIIVFRPPGQEDVDYVKRVIGVPGDRIEVRGGQLVINGEMVERVRLDRDFALPISANSRCKVVPGATKFVQPDESGQEYCLYPQFRETLPNGISYRVLDQTPTGELDEFRPVTVPEDHFFVMGDNRDDSYDSRAQPFRGGVGMLPRENIVGRAEFTYWSSDGSATWYLPWTWFSALRGSRVGLDYGDE